MTDDLSTILHATSPCYRPGSDDIAITSSARFVRNLSGINFVCSASDVMLDNVVELVQSRLESLGTKFPSFFAFHLEPSLVTRVVSERFLVSPKFVALKHPRGVAISDDLCTSVVINASDHVLLRHNTPGLDPEKALEKAEQLDSEFGKLLEYAYDDEYGFVTSSPKNIGTGLRLSVLLHLPALVIAGHFDRAINAANELGYTLKTPFAPTKFEPGHLFKLSSTKTLGTSEAEIVSGMMKVAPALISYEKKARETLLSAPRDKYFEDIVARSVGLLRSARMLALIETLDHLSIIRLGAALDLLPAKCADLLFDCLFELQPTHLQMKKGREMDSAERDVERSIIIRERMQRVLGNEN